MKEKVLLLFSLLIVCSKLSFSVASEAINEKEGLIFFTNFKYFKSNERNFKNVNEKGDVELNISDVKSLKTPETPKPILPPTLVIQPTHVKDTTTIPEKPIVKPETKPKVPDKPVITPPQNLYTDIFYNNDWIYDTHSYLTPGGDLIVSSNNNLFTGMGAVASGFSIENNNNVTIENGSSTTNLIGMLSLDKGGIINGEKGNITVGGSTNNFGMVVLGGGTGENKGNINVNDGAFGMYTKDSTLLNSNKIVVNNGAGMISTETGTIKNTGIIETSTSSTTPGFGMTTFGTSTATNAGTIVVNNSQIGMLSFDSSKLISNGVLEVSGGIGGYASEAGQMTNNGVINITNGGTGICIDGQGQNQAQGFNNSSGTINVESGSIGMSGVNNGIITNYGNINLVTSNTKIATSETNQEVGMYVTTNGLATNMGDINVGSNQIGMYNEGASNSRNYGNILISSQGTGVVLNNSTNGGSTFLNENTGVIKGDAVTGILLGGAGYVQNYGDIDISNGTAAVMVNGTGTIYNYHNINIANTKYGMLSLNGGGIINENISGYTSSIASDNNENAKMAVIGSGYALNQGTITSENTKYIMYLSGNGSLRNTGTLTSNITSNYSTYTTMYGEKGGTITNAKNGIININGGDSNYGMIISGSGQLTNDGTINAGSYQNGILITESATGINNGDVNFGIYGTGVSVYNTTAQGEFTNYGNIIGASSNYQGGTYGIYAFGEGKTSNAGLVKLDYGDAAIIISGGGTATNLKGGKIEIASTDYGMFSTNGATIENYGEIEVIPDYNTYSIGNSAMYVSGSSGAAINRGEIIVGGAYFNAMGTAGLTTIKNDAGGTITILDGAIQSFAFDLGSGTATNAGTVSLGTTGELVNNGTLFNYGYIDAPNGIKNGTNGILVMEQGGTTNTTLKEAVVGLSYASNIYNRGDKAFAALNLKFNATGITSYSYLYDIGKDNDEFLIRRKDFTEITEGSLGKFLEGIYFDSGNTTKDKFFNILRSARNSSQYNSYLDTIFGRDIYPNIIFQTKDTIEYTTNSILDNLEDKLTNNRKSSFIVGYTFEKFRQKGFDRVEGHDDNLNGFYLGKQYYLNDYSDYGFVFSYTRLDSDYYSNAGKREDNFLQGTAFMNYTKNDVKGVGAMYLGFTKGNIKRNFDLTYIDYDDSTPKYTNINDRYKGDTKNFYIGTSGKISKRYNFSSLFIEPEASAYLMGVFQNKINESGEEFNLHVDELNSFFSKVKTEIGVGKVIPIQNYQLTLKVIGGLGQELNSPKDDLKVSLREASEDKAKIKVDRENQFSKELGTKINLEKIGAGSLEFYVDYRYIFEDDDSWKVGGGVVYKF